MHSTTNANTPNGTLAEVVGLILPQILISGIAIFVYMMNAMSGVSCAEACDYELLSASNRIMVIGPVSTTVLVFILLLARRKARWKNWPIAVAGVLITVAMTAAAIVMLHRGIVL